MKEVTTLRGYRRVAHTPPRKGLALSLALRAHPRTPRWVHRHSPAAWAASLQAAAAAGWTADDVVHQISRWACETWIPDAPHRPIGLLARILKSADLTHRPAAEQTERRDRAAARKAAIAACPHCDELGWIEASEGAVKRCTHTAQTEGHDVLPA
ncbi:hypothetical protein ONR57_22795 [Hoyosella sp. YIM 151337]|uniref:hypothetical protein n=1 Tax=Hoyosella sp. YIM 151337 TaxID=2992742 RepID=UPI002235BB8A|nr:hypothetical protein [Hoyosella sp. YIM 151337]MCW4356138.1 hypothetical protein [Hoyosella sp. YIM 151337]